MLKTVDGEQIDPKEIYYLKRDGIMGQKDDLTCVIMKDGTEKWLTYGFDEILKAITEDLI
jgi:hypothetical protein